MPGEALTCRNGLTGWYEFWFELSTEVSGDFKVSRELLPFCCPFITNVVTSPVVVSDFAIDTTDTLSVSSCQLVVVDLAPDPFGAMLLNESRVCPCLFDFGCGRIFLCF